MQLISGRKKDLGGFDVARLLPHLHARNVGGFVFLDHMGPANFAPGQGIDVRPHPHIGLATVTYLFEGALTHRDSLGSMQDIVPGDVNWMTAGRGIAHSERTPAALRGAGSVLHGLQAWVALPRAVEEMAPAFEHYKTAAMPRIQRDGVNLQLVVGEAFGERSPVQAQSELWYLVGELRGGELQLGTAPVERALYVVDGEARVGNQVVTAGTLAVLPQRQDLALSAQGYARIALLGGAPLDGERHIEWNFVSSRRERIEQAKVDWQTRRVEAFGQVPGELEFIPLPG